MVVTFPTLTGAPRQPQNLAVPVQRTQARTGGHGIQVRLRKLEVGDGFVLGLEKLAEGRLIGLPPTRLTHPACPRPPSRQT